jgi:hypothetical protein
LLVWRGSAHTLCKKGSCADSSSSSITFVTGVCHNTDYIIRSFGSLVGFEYVVDSFFMGLSVGGFGSSVFFTLSLYKHKTLLTGRHITILWHNKWAKKGFGMALKMVMEY